MLMIVPLNSLKPGERGIVVNLQGGPGFRNRLLGMGITPGAVVQVIEVYNPGPLIISVSGTRFAIGRGMASRIIVRKL
ncbi:iron(II) transport protein A [Thermococcus kodakarensis KOD1]|uniref:Iron(II) transport protein A n=1 Tax=Thermococcus kodakarensis (strain ATCC BAA-918 / JCM 12380 / KOD1) TaxID=69014 RepID=Q5JIC5_THEKO|nr:iron(II) transport protein A [Thermococcus kodakarensis KOD1]